MRAKVKKCEMEVKRRKNRKWTMERDGEGLERRDAGRLQRCSTRDGCQVRVQFIPPIQKREAQIRQVHHQPIHNQQQKNKK